MTIMTAVPCGDTDWCLDVRAFIHEPFHCSTCLVGCEGVFGLRRHPSSIDATDDRYSHAP